MAGKFEGITKNRVKQVMDWMDKDGTDHLDIPFDGLGGFKEIFNVDTDAKSIKTITHSVTIRMNEVGPANWYFKVGYTDGGRVVRISRKRKEAYNLE